MPLLRYEVFIDCGAFDGDTVKNLIDTQEYSFEKIICFEPDPSNVEKLKAYISNLDNVIQEKVVVYQSATGKEKGKIRFSATGSGASAISLEGELEVDSIPLDEILADEAPTFIKMDIEGAEIDT
ncbi:MAG: FkbM family methyltransferase, partial [Microcystis sp.]